jgi:hypothetical protein
MLSFQKSVWKMLNHLLFRIIRDDCFLSHAALHKKPGTEHKALFSRPKKAHKGIP